MTHDELAAALDGRDGLEAISDERLTELRAADAKPWLLPAQRSATGRSDAGGARWRGGRGRWCSSARAALVLEPSIRPGPLPRRDLSAAPPALAE